MRKYYGMVKEFGTRPKETRNSKNAEDQIISNAERGMRKYCGNGASIRDGADSTVPQ